MWMLLAFLASVCFGLRGILYQWTAKRPIDRNLMLLGVYLCGMIVGTALALAAGQQWTAGAALGIVMGLFSYFSNAAIYKGFEIGKASLVAILSALAPASVATFAFFLWDERLQQGQLLALAVILAGVVMIRYSNDLSLNNLQGAQWGLAAMFGFTVTDLSTKQAMMWGGEVFATISVMYATGSVLFFVNWLRKRKAAAAVLQAPNETAASADGRAERAGSSANAAAVPWSGRKTLLWGMTVGLTNITGMTLITFAFKWGVTGLVSAIGAAHVLIFLLYVRIFLHERFSRLEATGIVSIIAGVLTLRLLG